MKNTTNSPQQPQNQTFTELFDNGCITDEAFEKIQYGMEMFFNTYIQGGIELKVKRSGKSQDFKVYRKDSDSGQFYTLNNTDSIGFSIYGESQSFWELTSIK